MVSVDIRSRKADDVRDVDAATFFGDELPRLMTERADLALPGAHELGLRPFAIGVVDRSWTLALEPSDDAGDDTPGSAGRLTVTPGTDRAAASVQLDAEGMSDIVNDLRTPVAFLTGGDLEMTRGRFELFLDWWVVLRSLLDGRPVHTAGAVDFHDRDGSPLDLARAFAPDDDPGAMAHFLAEAGFLHLAGVFEEAEMRAISDEMDAASSRYARGDGRSWWARTSRGDDRLVRMQYFHEQSPATAALLADDRLLRIGRLTDDGHQLGKPGPNPNLVEALVKPLGVVEGISDVPWHKDCSLGSHSYRCCTLTVGVSVTGADAESGQLRVVAGSHRALIQPAFVRPGLDLPQLDLPTRTGDVTVHLSCTLHMSQPPVTRERRVLYTDFSLPGGDHDPGEGKLRRIREGAPTTVSQKPAGVG
jgi:Phytanoyl-CoA dioxygenase (PhyH)